MGVTSFYLVLGAVLFSLGALGVIVRRNALIIFMCIELMLNGVNLSFIALASELRQLDGHVFAFFTMAIAAAEAAVGLAIILAVFRRYSSVRTDDVRLLQG